MRDLHDAILARLTVQRQEALFQGQPASLEEYCQQIMDAAAVVQTWRDHEMDAGTPEEGLFFQGAKYRGFYARVDNVHTRPEGNAKGETTEVLTVYGTRPYTRVIAPLGSVYVHPARPGVFYQGAHTALAQAGQPNPGQCNLIVPGVKCGSRQAITYIANTVNHYLWIKKESFTRYLAKENLPALPAAPVAPARLSLDL